MKTRLFKRMTFAAGFAVMTLSGQVIAETPSSSEPGQPKTLLEAMVNLGQEMQNITTGIVSENWSEVEKSALHIADHPRPPMSERMRIMSFLGSDKSKFKNYDKKTHATARIIAKAAADHDGARVISEFAILQQSCLNCHQNFRKKFQEHFNGQR